MKKEVSKIKQIIEKYNISFKNEKELTKWINKLNETEYNNLLRLEIDPKEITFSKEFLINKDLLNKKDYPLRIEAMSKIQCPSDCTHLMNNLMRKEFNVTRNSFKEIRKALQKAHPNMKYDDILAFLKKAINPKTERTFFILYLRFSKI